MAGVIEEAAFTDALVKELCSGRKLMEQQQPFREIQAAKEASLIRGHKAIPGLGKCIAVIPGREFFELRNKFGDEAFDDRDFWKCFNRFEPDMSPNKA